MQLLSTGGHKLTFSGGMRVSEEILDGPSNLVQRQYQRFPPSPFQDRLIKGLTVNIANTRIKKIQNWIILVAKFYIPKEKLFNQGHICLLEFLREAGRKLYTERLASQLEGKVANSNTSTDFMRLWRGKNLINETDYDGLEVGIFIKILVIFIKILRMSHAHIYTSKLAYTHTFSNTNTPYTSQNRQSRSH